MRKRDVTVGRSVKFTDHALAVSASVSCMDIGHLSDAIDKVNRSDVAFWHYDVVDGVFNQCLILGDLLYPYLKEKSRLPIEIHLAVEQPEQYIDIFSRYKLDYIAVHAETMNEPERVFRRIRECGALPVLAYRAETPPGEDFVDLAKKCAWVLKLTVNPGFSGQKIQDAAVRHIREMSDRLIHAGIGCRIQADGNVNEKTVHTLYEAGARIFTGGSSGLFTKERSIQENVVRLIQSAQCS